MNSCPDLSWRILQKQLLAAVRLDCHDRPLRRAVEDAFWRCPRHLFIPKFRNFDDRSLRTVGEVPTSAVLQRIYVDQPLILDSGGSTDVVATNSQPSLVLRLLNSLDLRPGHRVLEVGAGCGWLTAMIAHLVGPDGYVTGLEIISSLADDAQLALRRAGIRNARIVAADGSAGFPPNAPYDFVIFSAGTYDIPSFLADQIVPGGVVVIPVRAKGSVSSIFTLRRHEDHLVSMQGDGGWFVPLVGGDRNSSCAPVSLSALAGLGAPLDQCTGVSAPWWRWQTASSFFEASFAFRSFLSVCEPGLFALDTAGRDADGGSFGFGVYLPGEASLVLARAEHVESYGNDAAARKLCHHYRKWRKIGGPAIWQFKLSIFFAADTPAPNAQNVWDDWRGPTLLRWELPIA